MEISRKFGYSEARQTKSTYKNRQRKTLDQLKTKRIQQFLKKFMLVNSCGRKQSHVNRKQVSPDSDLNTLTKKLVKQSSKFLQKTSINSLNQSNVHPARKQHNHHPFGRSIKNAHKTCSFTGPTSTPVSLAGYEEQVIVAKNNGQARGFNSNSDRFTKSTNSYWPNKKEVKNQTEEPQKDFASSNKKYIKTQEEQSFLNLISKFNFQNLKNDKNFSQNICFQITNKEIALKKQQNSHKNQTTTQKVIKKYSNRLSAIKQPLYRLQNSRASFLQPWQIAPDSETGNFLE